jgi:hypothetical protein
VRVLEPGDLHNMWRMNLSLPPALPQPSRLTKGATPLSSGWSKPLQTFGLMAASSPARAVPPRGHRVVCHLEPPLGRRLAPDLGHRIGGHVEPSAAPAATSWDWVARRFGK